jgi:hypothetical protein
VGGPDERDQANGIPEGDGKPETGPGNSEPGIRGRQTNIAGHGDLAPGAGRRAMDHRDSRNLQVVNALNGPHEDFMPFFCILPALRVLFEFGDVAPGAKGRIPAPAEDDRPQIGILAEFPENSRQDFQHPEVKGVPLFGAVENNEPQMAGLRSENKVLIQLIPPKKTREFF